MNASALRIGSLVALTLSLNVVLNGAPAAASTIAPGFDQTLIPANDDGSSPAVTLPFSVDYFGTSFSSLYVNNNGNLTFGAPLSTYTPTGLGAQYSGLPIIAPFFADVDTRGAGSGLVGYGSGTYDGRAAFGATYPSVGYYNGQSNRLNTFQVLLTDRGDVAPGDFDVYFNYSQIAWETGGASGGTDGLGGTSAAAGFSAGTGAPGSYYQLPGSLVNGALLDGGPNSLVAGTNDGTPGQFLFEVRNGAVVVSPVPLPSSAPLFGAALVGLAGLGYGWKRRKAAVAA